VVPDGRALAGGTVSSGQRVGALVLLVGCATGPTGPKGQGTSERIEPSSESGDGAGKACAGRGDLPIGLSEHGIESGGIRRRFLVQRPGAASTTSALPVVFTLHGSGGTPEEQLALTGLPQLAEEKHFLLVAPEGIEQRWNVPPDPVKADDVRFIADLIDALSELACVDSRRVFSSGFSGGARMSSQLACDLSARIAAVAAIGGIRFPGPCAQARPFPVIAFHGTADSVNPYAGGGQPYWGTGVDDAILGWARHNGCSGPRSTAFAPQVEQIAYTGAGCTDVVLYRILDMDHTWPGVLGPGAASAQPSTANALLWSFFEEHPLESANP
jgi:polyhydroxybutyrate depolymerase